MAQVTFKQRHAEPKEVNRAHCREDCFTETEQSVERCEASAWDVQGTARQPEMLEHREQGEE